MKVAYYTNNKLNIKRTAINYAKFYSKQALQNLKANIESSLPSPIDTIED